MWNSVDFLSWCNNFQIFITICYIKKDKLLKGLGSVINELIFLILQGRVYHINCFWHQVILKSLKLFKLFIDLFRANILFFDDSIILSNIFVRMNVIFDLYSSPIEPDSYECVDDWAHWAPKMGSWLLSLFYGDDKR